MGQTASFLGPSFLGPPPCPDHRRWGGLGRGTMARETMWADALTRKASEVSLAYIPAARGSAEETQMNLLGLSRSWSIQDRSWPILGRSWSILGRSWSILGRSWFILQRSWSIPGRSWSIMGRSWSILGRSWSIKGRSGNDYVPTVRLYIIARNKDSLKYIFFWTTDPLDCLGWPVDRLG